MMRSRPLLSTMLKRSRYLLTAILGTALADASVLAADPVPTPAQSVETVNFLRRATPQGYGPRQYTPCPTCPQQAAPVVPLDPNAPKVDPKVDPNQPAQPQPIAPVAPDVSAMARADQGGTSAIHTNAPNLFGDLFGSKASIVTLVTPGTQSIPGAFNGPGGSLAVPASPPVNGQVTANLNNVVVSIPTATGGQIPVTLALNGGTVTQAVGSTPQPVTYVVPPQDLQNILPPGSPIPPNGLPLQTVLALAPNLPINTTTLPPAIRAQLPPGTPATVTMTQLLSAIEAQRVPGASIAQLGFGTATASYVNGQLVYNFPLTEVLAVPTTNTNVIGLPTPGAGGVVGLLKISEDNSPFPRDRVIFTYDYFNNTQINAGGTGPLGVPVNRYQFGFEKTFFQGRASFEVRVPFANTQSSTAMINTGTQATEFGNMRLTAKALLRKGEVLNFSGGLGISLPTADDVILTQLGGGEVVHIDNKSVQLSPFVAAQFTPNARLFAQAWYGFCFDTGGNNVRIDPIYFGVPTMNPNLGPLVSPALMQVDGQIGYWLYQADQGLVRGVAPFIELHYSGNVGKGTLFAVGTSRIGNATDYQEFNITSGVTTRLAQNTTLAVAAAAPLLNNRTFDYQIGVRLNWYFGYTARQRQNGSASNLAPNSF